MQILLDDEVEPFVAGLLGGVSISSGPTSEQMIVLDSITRQLWRRDDIDLQNLTPLSPDQVAKRLPRPEARLRFAEMMMTLELCRHPMSLEQVAVILSATSSGVLPHEGPHCITYASTAA